jgi:serine protease Do
MNILKIIGSFFLFSLIVYLGWAIHGLSKSYHKITDQVTCIEHKLQNLDIKMPLCPAESSSNKKFAQSWGDLQKQLQDTVVQFFVNSSEINILEPYRVPQQSQGLGSGFFISEQGEIITNAHVVNQASSILIQIPSFGKQQFEVDLVGIMPEKDFALVKLREEDRLFIKNTLGKFPFLHLGDSDLIARADEVMALGYPLGQQSLKSTTGVISGREGGMVQMSAAINPGNSGGPTLNVLGEVVGISTAGILSAQNVGYIIPINDVKVFLADLRAGGLVRKPYMGIYQSTATKDLVKALGNPEPGGTYIVEVLPDSPLHEKLLPGDMIYSINGNPVDLYGEMFVDWSEDKISTAEYISRLSVGGKVTLVAYRNGKKKVFETTFSRKELAPIRLMHVGYEPLEYEIFGGIVVMPLMVNHLPILGQVNGNLGKYAKEQNQMTPALVITHVMPNSVAYKTRVRLVGSILTELNGKAVTTLEQLRKVLQDSGEMITIKTDDHVLAAMKRADVLEQEAAFAQIFSYNTTQGMQALLKKYAHSSVTN